MTLADKITSTRLILAPVFFIIYLLPRFFPSITELFWTVPVLWVLFLLSEISDMFDGMVARKREEVSDFGKFYDPFADTLTQITYFFCFVIDGILPALLFLAVLYREFSILFIRNLMLKKGTTLGASWSGKIKTVTYIVAAGLALLASSVLRLGFDSALYRWLIIAATAVFILSVIIAVISFIGYLLAYLKAPEIK
jgi:CDP-diacylglycerol--glycerol-3-phosphate 3-phosphatidyltransferase